MRSSIRSLKLAVVLHFLIDGDIKYRFFNGLSRSVRYCYAIDPIPRVWAKIVEVARLYSGLALETIGTAELALKQTVVQLLHFALFKSPVHMQSPNTTHFFVSVTPTSYFCFL